MKIIVRHVVFISFFLAFALTSCSRKLTFVTSPVVPAAEGFAKISKDGNGNFAIAVKIKRLADPERLQPKRDLYVVWMVTEKSGTRNIGQLKSSSGFFSSVLEGELNAVSPFKPERVFITAENDARIQQPGSMVILTTKGKN
ncbi:hypothetical protein LJ707_17690 [Mucilaginibacter sp. UR6-1]|uniref:hypothetical protein n=1 Tax=Mucilaginibacter sp. UR6-1 TaxID=1435643 RepID=UPI001E2D6055|nr:hypothetical protein [Mucilaginibacter sp. UR6-1]MCC8410779.1 hypothetical protein [Mucilaginibacter sp. UR6-1]